MCRLKSGIILKDYVFIPDYDSHTDMLEELKIKDNITNASTLFVRAELQPPYNNIFSDISTWEFNVDQDILPGWFVYNYDKQRMIEAVKRWSKDHVFENIDNLELKGNNKYYLKNCKNVEAYDNCTINARRGNCTINAYNGCKIYAHDNCIINAYNSCTVDARTECMITAYDDCTIYASNNCTVKAQNKCVVIVHSNCKVNAYNNCIINAQYRCMITAHDNCIVNTNDKCKVNYK